MSMWDPILDISDRPEPKGPVNPPLNVDRENLYTREKFETLFKETQDYKSYIEMGFDKKVDIFVRHPEEGWYYHSSVALAWKFYQLGAE